MEYCKVKSLLFLCLSLLILLVACKPIQVINTDHFAKQLQQALLPTPTVQGQHACPQDPQQTCGDDSKLTL